MHYALRNLFILYKKKSSFFYNYNIIILNYIIIYNVPSIIDIIYL